MTKNSEKKLETYREFINGFICSIKATTNKESLEVLYRNFLKTNDRYKKDLRTDSNLVRYEAAKSCQQAIKLYNEKLSSF
jgi:hypothetical protein